MMTSSCVTTTNQEKGYLTGWIKATAAVGQFDLIERGQQNLNVHLDIRSVHIIKVLWDICSKTITTVSLLLCWIQR